MEPKDDRDAVSNRIKEAFQNTPPPTQITRRLDGSGEEDVTRQMQGKVWQKMKRKDFFPNWAMMPLLAPEAFHYFLPAFLLNALQYDTDEFIGIMAETTATSLIPRAPGNRFYSEFVKRVSLLTPSQRVAVASFVSHWKANFSDGFEYFDVDWSDATLNFWSTPALQPPFTPSD